MTKKKPKSMPAEEFKVVLEGQWAPVRLEPVSWPGWLRNIPKGKVKAVIASGDVAPGIPHFTEDDLANATFEIGGIDVYRYAEPKDGVKLNKDWYSVVYDPSAPDKFAVVGPIKDSEHWIDELPDRLKHLDLAPVPTKDKP
jgi:hypothetical protein